MKLNAFRLECIQNASRTPPERVRNASRMRTSANPIISKKKKILFDIVTSHCHSGGQMETGDEFLIFNYQQLESIKNVYMEITQFTTFEVLSLDCNHVEGFQKSEKLETVWIWGRYLRVRGICMKFGRRLAGHSLVATQ